MKRKDGTSRYVRWSPRWRRRGTYSSPWAWWKAGPPWAEIETSQARGPRTSADTCDPETAITRPSKPGEKWDYQPKPKNGGQAAKRTYTSVAEEEVEVPAGKYKAIRIDETWDDGRGLMRSSQWHAPGVGLVKQSTFKGSTETGVYVLKSFKPGK